MVSKMCKLFNSTFNGPLVCPVSALAQCNASSTLAQILMLGKHKDQVPLPTSLEECHRGLELRSILYPKRSTGVELMKRGDGWIVQGMVGQFPHFLCVPLIFCTKISDHISSISEDFIILISLNGSQGLWLTDIVSLIAMLY